MTTQYGIPRAVEEKRAFDIVSTSRTVEAYVESVHGFQMLYADSYMTRDEFRQSESSGSARAPCCGLLTSVCSNLNYRSV